MHPYNAPAKLILLVEDNSDIREVFAMCLQETGYEVMQAADGREALALMRQRQPHAVITDLQMPNVDGIELARAMKNTTELADIPLGLVTAVPMLQRLADSRKFARVLIKPCSLDDLTELAAFLINLSVGAH